MRVSKLDVVVLLETHRLMQFRSHNRRRLVRKSCKLQRDNRNSGSNGNKGNKGNNGSNGNNEANVNNETNGNTVTGTTGTRNILFPDIRAKLKGSKG